LKAVSKLDSVVFFCPPVYGWKIKSEKSERRAVTLMPPSGDDCEASVWIDDDVVLLSRGVEELRMEESGVKLEFILLPSPAGEQTA
jgi:hypothetical protein